MKMKLMGSLGLLLATALATAEGLTETRVTLELGPTETGVAISISKEGLHLGQTSLEPWPFDAPSCTDCTLTLERDFSPVGPDRTLRLTARGAASPTWFFAERLRLPASLPGNATLRAQSGSPGLRLEAEGEQATLTAGEAVSLNNCLYHLIWYSQPTAPANPTAEPAPDQQTGGVAPVPEQTFIAEDPTRLIQIQGQCS